MSRPRPAFHHVCQLASGKGGRKRGRRDKKGGRRNEEGKRYRRRN